MDSIFSYLTLIVPGYSQNYLTWEGGGAFIIPPKSFVSAIFLQTKQQKTFNRTLGTQDHASIESKISLGPSLNPTWT